MNRKPFIIGVFLTVLLAAGMFSAALAQTATPSPVSPTATLIPASPTPDTDAQAAALVEQGITLFQDGKYPEAVDAYTQALALKPDDINAYIGRAVAYTNLGEYDQALSDYERGIELQP